MTEAPERIWAFEERGSRWHYGHWDLCGPGDYERIEYLRADLVPAMADRIEALEAENARLRGTLVSVMQVYEARTELFTSDADCAANMYDRACAALNKEMTDEGE